MDMSPEARAYLSRIMDENRRLREHALIDELTQLGNREWLRLELAWEFERARKYQRPLACLIGGIDDFPAYASRFGQKDSSTVVQEAGRIVKRQLFRRDRAFYDGESFVALISETPIEYVKKAAGRVADAVKAYNAPNTQVTMSFGISYYPHTGIRTQDDLVSRAEMALAHAQKSSRDRICTIDDLPGM